MQLRTFLAVAPRSGTRRLVPARVSHRWSRHALAVLEGAGLGFALPGPGAGGVPGAPLWPPEPGVPPYGVTVRKIPTGVPSAQLIRPAAPTLRSEKAPLTGSIAAVRSPILTSSATAL